MKIALFLLICAPVAVFAITVEEAAQEASKVTTPSYGEMLTHENRVNTLPTDALGDTESLENLKGDDGMGDIFSPATNKTQNCMTLGDPECLAIQVVKGNANQVPTLDETTKNEIHDGYQDIIDNANDLTEGGSDLVSSEIRCETVTTVIPGREQLEVCDEGLLFENVACTQGWEMSKELKILYHCSTLQNAIQKECTIVKQAVGHKENIVSCLATPAQTEEKVCRFMNDATVTQVFPYQCEVHQTQTKEKKCIRTLTVDVVQGCSTSYQSSASLEVFKEVGYTASNRYQTMHLTQYCREPFRGLLIKFGNKTLGSFPSVPSTVNATYILDFVFTLEEDNGEYVITVTNVEKGLGTRIVTVRQPKLSVNPQQIDRWEELCQ